VLLPLLPEKNPTEVEFDGRLELMVRLYELECEYQCQLR
jgi:hypothetical protein